MANRQELREQIDEAVGVAPVDELDEILSDIRPHLADPPPIPAETPEDQARRIALSLERVAADLQTPAEEAA